MQPIRTFSSRTVVLPFTNIDTDQIIPARFLTTTTKEGLGKQAFADWRYDATGAPKTDFVLNRPEANGCSILVAGRNFGCGSSREHAPWALLDYGFRAVISTRFADIFHGNALKNGLLPVTVPEDVNERLLHWPADHAGSVLAIDVAAQTLTLPDGAVVKFPIASFAKHCLLNGVDELGFLLEAEPAIAAYEAAHS